MKDDPHCVLRQAITYPFHGINHSVILLTHLTSNINNSYLKQLSGPASEPFADISLIQELLMPLSKNVLWSQSRLIQAQGRLEALQG